MDELKSIIKQVIAEAPKEPVSEREKAVRLKALTAHAATKGERLEPARLAQYVDSTLEIPFGIFMLSIKCLIRSHKWPKFPQVADFWDAAREVAGMNLEPYRAGQYLATPNQWPPEGHRYTAVCGELETLPTPSVAVLASGKTIAGYLGTGE